MENFKVGLRSHFKSGIPIMLGLLVCILFPYLLSLAKDENIASFFVIPISIFMIGVLPTIIIHINYYLANRGDSLMFSSQDSIITITHKGKPTTFTLDDIDHIEKYMSYNLAANRSGVIPWDDYNHAIIYLKDGQEFIVTSLLVPNLNLLLEAEKIVIKTNFYRFVKVK